MSSLKTIVLAVLTLLTFVSRAGIEIYSNRIEGNDLDPALTPPTYMGGVFEVYDDKYFEMSVNPFWTNDFTNHDVRNIVRVGINPEIVQNTSYSGTMDVEVTYWQWTGSGFTTQVVTKTLSFSNNSGTVTSDDMSSFVFDDAHYIQVEVLSVTGTGFSYGDLFLESIIEVERYYTLENTIMTGIDDRPIPTPGSWTNAEYSNASNEFIELHWPYHYGAESYEVEFVHISDYLVAYNAVTNTFDVSNMLQSAMEYDYYLNSTRIEVDENFYKVPNIFDNGYFIYRVRPIGRTGTAFDERVEGQWSSPESGNLYTTHDQNHLIKIEREYDASMNWVHQTAYTEKGKRFESVSFVDGLGRARQSVSRNTATDQVIVSNVYYDELGRAVIQDLPTPQDEDYPHHFNNFNVAVSPAVTGESYQYLDFDSSPGATNCNLNSKGMSDASGASKYYSDQNANQDGANGHIPDAEDFPFTRITYKDDFTGRIDRIAGAGGELKMGNANNAETRMIYVSSSQAELNKMFGVEVGWSNHYQKLVTIDPNGQAYVQYSDMAGRTIASYMTGPSPTNLTALDNNPGTQLVEHELLTATDPYDQNIDLNPPVSTMTYTQYFPELSEDYTFEYGFSPQQFDDICLISGVCLDCVYDLTIEIVEECGMQITIPTPTVTINGGTLDGLCNGVYSYNMTPFTVTIPRGVYTIKKTLSVNQQAINDYWCIYIDNQTTSCLPSVSDDFNVLYADEPFTSCTPEELTADYLDYSACDSRRVIMLYDVSPGGQYADYDPSTFTSTDPTSLFHSSNTSVWTGATYLDAGGSPILVTDPSTGSSVSPGALSAEHFIALFDPQWAEALIDFHPEYCMLGYCDDNAASYAYDQAMLDTYTYAAACSTGYIFPLGLTAPGLPNPPTAGGTLGLFASGTACSTSSTDPFFFSPSIGASYFADMRNDMDFFIQVDNSGTDVDVSIWMYAMAMTVDPNATTWSEVYAAYQTFTSQFQADNYCLLDYFWTIFRGLYLDLKQEYYQEAQEDYMNDITNCPNIPSPAIGMGSGDYGDKIPVFPTVAYMNYQINQTSSSYGGGSITVTSQSSVQGFVNSVTMSECADACEAYAQEWVDLLAACIDPADEADILQAFTNICTNGCDQEHPNGASTPNPTSVVVEPITGLTNPSIQDILDHYGYTETTLCTELLISSPAPYDLTTSTFEDLVQPLDDCGCDALFQAEADAPSGTTVEEQLFTNTGIEIEDADYLLCACRDAINYPTNTWSPGYSWSASELSILASWDYQVPANLTCPENNCIDCDAMNTEITALVDRFDGGVTGYDFEDYLVEFNSKIILTNYLNDQFNFHQSADAYLNFYYSCNATSGDEYCYTNPLVEDLNEVMKLIAFRGQLLASTAIDLNTENIVYANTALEEAGLGYLYSASESAGTLTSTFSNGTTSCTLAITIPSGLFDFEDIFSFESVVPNTSECSGNNSYTAEVKYVECGIIKIGYVNVVTDCFEVNVCACGATELCDDAFNSFEETECYQPKLDELYQLAIEQFEGDVEAAYDKFVEDYNDKCSLAFDTETMSYEGPDRQYQFTLYYYDQSGSLVKTEAPEGITPLTNMAQINADRTSITGTPAAGSLTSNTYETRYVYNSYGQLISTENPDQEGETKFWYDFYGRIVASQNPVQANLTLSTYSYTIYDIHGRPIEVGQVAQTLLNELVDPLTGDDPNVSANDLGATFQAWVALGVKSEVTVTKYDEPANGFVPLKFSNGEQENLRLRVASVFYHPNGYSGTPPSGGKYMNFESAVHYSYDIHGNVKEQIQDVPLMQAVGQQLSTTQYEYELISGNVKKVVYEKDELDYFEHEYHYDAMNRLEEVLTTTDGIHKTREAHYRYYDYGPLARVEIGQYKVQGMDYAYTINGWLKGMNSTFIDVNNDMGIDGNVGYLADNTDVHELFAQDVVSYTLGYFDNDYNPILSTSSMEATYAPASPFAAAGPALFNGNIRHVVKDIYAMERLGNTYQYDQLNRLKNMTGFWYSGTTNDWGTITGTSDYNNYYSYDRNGNLTSLFRNAVGGAMDNFTYAYVNPLANNSEGPAGGPSNRLASVTDAITGTGPSGYGDIQDGTHSYTYDEIGQLTSDASENIQSLVWRNGDKKLKQILSDPIAAPTKEDIEFIYNPFGQRIIKIIKPKAAGVILPADEWTYVYYTYDANGSVMSTYDIIMGVTINKSTVDEQFIYGASRLGLYSSQEVKFDGTLTTPPATDIYQNTLVKRRYEITGHLGDVNAVISDRREVAAIGAQTLYEAFVVSTADYYPFGMVMPGRQSPIIAGEEYRFGYNGMEMDNEVSDNGNSYTTEFRQYDPRLGRWKSLDPLMSIFPSISPYSAFDNNPIYYTDIYGLESDGPGDDENVGIKGESSKPRRRYRDPETGKLTKWKKGDVYENADGDRYTYLGDEAKGKFDEKWERTAMIDEVLVLDEVEVGPQTEVIVSKNKYVTKMEAVNPDHHAINNVGLLALNAQAAKTGGIPMTAGEYKSLHDQWEASLPERSTSGALQYYSPELDILLLAEGGVPKLPIKQATKLTTTTVLKSLGRGSTGRTTAVNIIEQLAMKEIKSNPEGMGMVIKKNLSDARWKGWCKLSNKTAHGVEIHFVGKFENGKLTAVDDFKFVDK